MELEILRTAGQVSCRGEPGCLLGSLERLAQCGPDPGQPTPVSARGRLPAAGFFALQLGLFHAGGLRVLNPATRGKSPPHKGSANFRFAHAPDPHQHATECVLSGRQLSRESW